MMLVRMDDAFCQALQRAINAGTENVATVVSKQPGTRNPKTLTAAQALTADRPAAAAGLITGQLPIRKELGRA